MARILIIAAAVAVIIAVLVSGSATGQARQTLTFTVPPPAARDQNQVDLPPSGPSLGDQSIVAGSLRMHGQLFGRVLTLCEFNDATFRASSAS